MTRQGASLLWGWSQEAPRHDCRPTTGIMGPDPSVGFRPSRFSDRWSREEAMSAKSQSRRDVLRKAAAISAAASFGGIGTTGAVAATEAARSAAQRNLDPILRQATESRAIPAAAGRRMRR